MSYLTYNTQNHPKRNLRGYITGEIGMDTSVGEDILLTLGEYQNITLEEGNYETHYHNGQEIVEKQILVAELNKDYYTIGDVAILNNLPVPCALRIDGEDFETSTGKLEIEIKEKAVYKIENMECSYENKVWVIYAF